MAFLVQSRDTETLQRVSDLDTQGFAVSLTLGVTTAGYLNLNSWDVNRCWVGVAATNHHQTQSECLLPFPEERPPGTRRATRNKGNLGQWKEGTQRVTGFRHLFPPYIPKEACIMTPGAQSNTHGIQ